MKKSIILFASLLLGSGFLFAQEKKPTEIPASGVKMDSLPIVYINNAITIHFISPEPITYVDISSLKITGDLPVKNILRIRRTDTSRNQTGNEDAIVSIVGEKFIAQYRIVNLPYGQTQLLKSDVDIVLKDTRPLDIAGISMSQNEMKNFAMVMAGRKPVIHAVSAAAYGLREELNNIYAIGDYIFLDISCLNNTNLKYDIDEIRFKVEDKKVTKASTIQSVEIKPDFIFSSNPSFKKRFRNIYVFKKFTFPGNKVLNVEMTEKQLSGRVITLQIDYSDILNADTL